MKESAVAARTSCSLRPTTYGVHTFIPRDGAGVDRGTITTMGRKLGNYLLSNRRATQEDSPGIEVKTGRNLATNQSVTVKIFDINTFAFAAGVHELLKFEVGTLSRLEHPNIVRLVEVLASPTKIFVVMERVCGEGDLFDAIVAEGRYK